MHSERKQFKVNMPDEVKRWLAEQSAKNMRSQTAEIVLALKEKMEMSATKATETKKGEASA